MRKLFIITCFILVFSGFTIAQDNPVLVNKVDRYVGDGEFIVSILENIADRFLNGKNKDSFVALRVCSPDPLDVTFARDEYDTDLILFRIREDFKVIPLSNVYLLRDSNCIPDTTKFYTEYWYVPKNADFPPFVEIKKIQDLSAEVLIGSFYITGKNLVSDDESDDNIDLTPEFYEAVKHKLVEKLRTNKTAFVLINYANQSYSDLDRAARKSVLKKAFQLRAYLMSQGIGKYRIFVKEAKDYYTVDNNSKITAYYPDVTIAYQK